LYKAKRRLRDVVDSAIQHGPQIITQHGDAVAVILSYADYQAMSTAGQKLSDFFRLSPLVGGDLDLNRHDGAARPPLVL
jgi:prevent-host-death family protein